MKFIESVALIRCSEADEIAALFNNYDRKMFFYDEKREVWVLTRFKDFGLQVEIRRTPEDCEIKRPDFDMAIYVTPAKLLHPNVDLVLGGPTSKDEISKACRMLQELAYQIEEESDVNILSEALIWCVNVGKECVTPSDIYSRELIRALKKSIRKCDYSLYDPYAFNMPL